MKCSMTSYCTIVFHCSDGPSVEFFTLEKCFVFFLRWLVSVHVKSIVPPICFLDKAGYFRTTFTVLMLILHLHPKYIYDIMLFISTLDDTE